MSKASKILIAEDNMPNQVLIKAICDMGGYEVDIVNDGLEAIEAVKSNQYTLVLMDIHMPRMSGPEAIKAIRALPSPVQSIPIITVTADLSPETIQSCRDAGATEIETKPIDIEGLHAKMNALIGQLEAA